ncbi:unnamed protein product [Prorocentrum cordatum]|uniref:Uncharacterized protein n=1 Tax=Prorocentrum cordatum TaxID=2364126 RepID=A0ABN9UT55_9DINO|nr:unnamed protein product [Polarella glacialis]
MVLTDFDRWLQAELLRRSFLAPLSLDACTPARRGFHASFCLVRRCGRTRPSDISDLHGLAASLRHARQLSSVEGLLAEISRVALPELHPTSASVDSVSGLLAVITALCKDSAF